MSWERDLLCAYSEATRPTEAGPARIKRRLLSPDADPQVRALLRGLPVPEPGAADRVRRRLSARARPVRWLAPVGALAAVGALALGITLAGSDPASVLSLESSTWASAAADEHVALSFQGSGAAHSEGHTHHISWESGVLEVNVDPGQGEQVVVTTPEATVRVVGTVFRVERDKLGTRVEVSRGAVALTCGQAQTVELGAQSNETCLPVTADRWLARTTALSLQGAEPEAILQSARAGLSLPASEIISQELGQWQATSLHELVAAAIGDGTQPDCLAALPRLGELQGLGLLEADEAAWLEHCQAQ